MSMLLLLISFSSPAASSANEAEFSNDFNLFQYGKVIEDYKQLSKEAQDNPENCYKFGFACLRKHDFLSAENPLRIAVDGFAGYDNYPSPKELLDRVNTLKRLCPPYYKDVSLNGTVCFKVYGRPTPWLQSVASEFDYYAKRVREVFGANAPVLSCYFFDNRSDYEEFYKTMFGTKITRDWQDGTGDSNVILFCERTVKGGMTGDKNLPYLRGCILHEMGHALCNTIYGEQYLKVVPAWFDEGMSDELAKTYFSSWHFQWYSQLLKEAATKGTAPSYSQMCNKLYEDANTRYAFAKEMAASIVVNQKPDVISNIVRAAKRRNGDFEAAIREVTGTSPHAAYEKTVEKFWKVKQPVTPIKKNKSVLKP